MRLLPALGVSLASAVLTGCAALKQVPPQTTPVQSENISFKFAKDLPDGKVLRESQARQLIFDELEKNTRVVELERVYSQDDPWPPYRGADVKASQTGATFKILNGEISKKTGNFHATVQSADYGVRVTDQGDYLQVAVKTPGKFTTTFGGLVTNEEPYLTDAQMIAEINHLNQSMDPKYVVEKWYTGDFNADYSDISVFANFKRILSVYDGGNRFFDRIQADNSKDEIEKAQVFWLGTDDGKVPVSVKVFPYRDGSKVEYAFQVPIVYDNDGSISDPDSVAEVFVGRLKDVAND